MKIVIPGGSGQVGRMLARAFHADGHEVVVLSRTPAEAAGRVVGWTGATLGSWAAELEGADAVNQPGGRNRELPLHDAQSPSHHGFARELGANHRPGHRARVPAAPRLVAGQHRNYLRPSV